MRVLLPMLLALAGCADKVETLAEAQQAYGQSRIAEAEAVFSRVGADPAAPAADRAAALRGAAQIAWLIDGDGARAMRALDASLAIGDDRCRANGMRHRILLATARAEALLSGVAPILARCPDRESQESFRLDAADAALALKPADLERAETWLASAGDDARTGLRGAALALEIGLLRGDAAAALKGWRDYFWLTDTDAPPGLGLPSGRAAQLFAQGAVPNASSKAQLALADLLVRAGFARPAERFAASRALATAAPADPLWRKVSAYLAARAQLATTILASNRRVARGGDADDLAAAVTAMEDRLIAAARLSGDRKAALRRAYGLYGTVGDTGGFASVHLGHVVEDQRRAIDQYGHRARVGFLVVDNMLSNGYESWLWDGSAAAGGWTEPGPVIVQVRPEYTSGPLNAWRLVSDPARRGEVTGRQAKRAAEDRAALAAADVAFLPGLADRLRLQLAGQVLARARRLVAPGGDLRRAFLEEYWRATVQQSIFVHEGRHALDRTLVTGLARLRDSNLEYRAKLSELALADYPRLALYNIDAETIGGDTAHGIANGRILSDYRDWMTKNRAAVRGFDPNVAALAQLDRLSDAQIRAVARGLDPIAR